MRVALAALLLAAPAHAEGVPSGTPAALWQVLFEQVGGETQMVLRFLAPGIAEGYPEGAEAADLDWLCAAHAPAVAATPYARADSVVVTLLDRPLRRGVTDPDAVQFFGAYRLADGACVAEMF